MIMEWSEGKDLGILPDEEVMHAEESPLYNKLPENEKQDALFTDGSCQTVGVKDDRLMYIVLLDKLQRLRKRQAYQWIAFFQGPGCT